MRKLLGPGMHEGTEKTMADDDTYPPQVARARFHALLRAVLTKGSPPDHRKSRRGASGGWRECGRGDGSSY